MSSANGSTRPSGGGGARGCLFLLPALLAAAVVAYLLRDGLPPGVAGIPPELVVAAALLLLSLLVGLVFFFRSLRGARTVAAADTVTADPGRPVVPLTGSAKTRGKGRFGAGCFFGVFLLFGLGFMIPFAWMLWGVVTSHLAWEETRCTITSSAVGSHSDSDGTTYSIDITYRYEWEGQPYTGDRYNFSFGSSSGREGKAKVVARYPSGEEVPCWVHPGRPEKAVLARTVGWEALFVLLPLVFVVIGGGGLLAMAGVFGPVSWSQRKEDWLPGTTDEETPRAPATSGEAPSPATLRHEYLPEPTAAASADPDLLQPSTSPKGRLIGSTIAAVFWNGIVWTILYFGWIRDEGGLDGCALAFLGLFALIGLLLLVSVPYYALALANPRPVVRIAGPLAPGRSARLSWRFDGRAQRIRRLVIRIEGREEATYRRGTDTHTAKRTFYEATLLDAQDQGAIPSGELALTLPADTMHSFDGGNNKVVWGLILEGDIPRWPDVKEELALTVRPEGLAR